MNLSAKQREAAFPITIELGKKESEMMNAVPMKESGGGRGKKSKPRTYYPTVYIDSMPGLEQLPKEGCMLVEFRRKRLSIEENIEGDETAGVTLELRALCLPEDGGGMSDNDSEGASDMETAMRNAMKKTTSEKDDEDDEEE